MIEKNIGGVFIAVPLDSVTLNGIYLRKLNKFEEPYSGYWNLVAIENLRAVDDEWNKPYLYRTLEDASDDAMGLISSGEFSTCGGVVKIDPIPSEWKLKHETHRN